MFGKPFGSNADDDLVGPTSFGNHIAWFNDDSVSILYRSAFNFRFHWIERCPGKRGKLPGSVSTCQCIDLIVFFESDRINAAIYHQPRPERARACYSADRTRSLDSDSFSLCRKSVPQTSPGYSQKNFEVEGLPPFCPIFYRSLLLLFQFKIQNRRDSG